MTPSDPENLSDHDVSLTAESADHSESEPLPVSEIPMTLSAHPLCRTNRSIDAPEQDRNIHLPLAQAIRKCYI